MSPLVQRPLVFCLCLYAFFTPFDTAMDFAGAGSITKYVGICVAILGLVALIVGHRRVVRPSREVVGWTLYQVLCVASLGWATNIKESLDYLMIVSQLFLLYAVVSITPLPWRAVRLVLYSGVAGGAMLAAYSEFLVSRGSTLWTQRLVVSVSQGVSDPNHTGAALLFPVALTLIVAAHQPWTRLRLPLLGLLVLLFAGVYATVSRGSVIGIAAILMYFVIRSKKRLLPGSILALSLAALVTFPNAMLHRFLTDSDTGSGRGSLWAVAVEGFKQHWLYGAGIANFPSVYDDLCIRIDMHDFESWHRPAHSLVFSTAVDLGVIGLFLLAFAIFFQFRALRFVPREHPLYDFRIALEAGMIGIFVSALFLDVMFHKYVWYVFMMVSLFRLAVTYAPAVEPTARSHVVRAPRFARAIPS